MNKICNLLYQCNENQAEMHEIVVDLEVEIIISDCYFGFGYSGCTWRTFKSLWQAYVVMHKHF
jgi:hypothetical protein